jgi:sugar lactone lactonase YvrE
MRLHLLMATVLLSACKGEGDGTQTTTEPDEERPGVMRDCPADVGTICPWAGAGYNGFNGDDVHQLDAWFSFPMSAAHAPGKDPIIADWNNHKLRAVLPNPEDGFTTIMGTDFLGDGDPELKDSTPEGAPGTSVNLNHPTQQLWMPDGTLLSASWHTHKLRTWDPATGLVHVYLGGAPGFAGTEFDEPADETQLNQPKAVLLDTVNPDLVYILDMRNERIRMLDRASWTVSTIAGTGAKCLAANGDELGLGGPALDACFGFPKNDNPEPGGAFAMTADGNTLFIADSENHIIEALDMTTGTLELVAGTPGVPGDVDGAGADAQFFYPVAFALDEASGQLFVADANNHKVRAIDLATYEVSTFAGTGEASCDLDNGLLVPVSCDNQHDGGDGGAATDATLYRPFGVDLDNDGNLVIADTYNHRFRIVYR